MDLNNAASDLNNAPDLNSAGTSSWVPDLNSAGTSSWVPDLNNPGTSSWVDDIRQKIETMLHDAEDFVKQESVKYFENKVRDMSQNIMRFYSEIVQDSALLPIDDSMRNEAELIIQQRTAAIEAHLASMFCGNSNTINNENFAYTREEEDEDHYQNFPLFDVTPPVAISDPVDAVNDADKNSDSSMIVNAKIEPFAGESEFSSNLESSQFESPLFNELSSNDNHENDLGALETKSPPTIDTVIISSANVGLDFFGEAETICSLEKSDCGSCASTEIADGVDSSFLSCKNTIDNAENKSIGGCSLSTEVSDVIFHKFPVDTHGYTSSDSFSSLFYSSLTDVAEMQQPIFCASNSAISMDSFDQNASEADENFVLISSSKNGNVQFGSSNAHTNETIDLGEEASKFSRKLKLEDNSAVVDRRRLSSVAQKLCSYKEKIRNALAFKKRLEKEYEELAISHGANAAESSYHCHCHMANFPAPPSMPLDSRNSQTNEFSDSEWELL